MKNFFAALTIMAAAAVAPAFAEPTATLRVNVPFDFVAGKVTLPAGQYEMSTISMPDTVHIRSTDGRVRAFLRTTPAGVPGEKYGMVFQTVNGKHFLVGMNGTDGSRQLLRVPAEVRVELASASTSVAND